MFDELTKYKINDHFLLTAETDLEEVCNAPKDKIGVFIVYVLKNGRIEMVYIGSSGKVQNNGKINKSNGGLYDTIVNGHQFGEVARKISWKQKIIKENIEVLNVYWYSTHDSVNRDIPAFVESQIIQRFYEVHGRLPRWNKET